MSKVENSEAFQVVALGRGKLIEDMLQRLFPRVTIPSRKASSFPWMPAADFFSTREAAGLLESLSSELREVAHQTISHLKWRFFQFFSDPKLLGIMAGPVLSYVVSELQKIAGTIGGCGDNGGFCGKHDGKNNDVIRDVHVYCCHDVTLLALHRCLRSTR